MRGHVLVAVPGGESDPGRCVLRSGETAGTYDSHERLRTSCGRQLTTGRLALGDAGYPVTRIFVDLGDCPGYEDNHWASLTVAEARQLAAHLLAEAAAAEEECALGRDLRDLLG
jgi:hypothetical protein